MGGSASVVKNTPPCTKRILTTRIINKPSFTDSQNPFVLEIIHKKMIPHADGGSGLGNMFYTDVQRLQFTNIYQKRMESEAEAEKIMTKLKNGYCFKCNSIGSCKYINPHL
jgi:hypothetical protein